MIRYRWIWIKCGKIFLIKMKVYFTASTTGKKKFRDRYLKIVKVLEKLGHKVMITFLTTKEEKDFLKKSAKIVCQETKKQIEETDVVIAELGDYTFGSFGVGWRVNYALSIQKPVLCLYPEGYDTYYISPLLKGSTSEFLTLKSYTLRLLPKILAKYFKRVKRRQSGRVNFVSTPLINEYLEWAVFHKGTTKSELIRDLLLKAAQNDKGFQKRKEK